MNINLNNPLVSIIIVNYNGKDLLKDCLESIKKIDYTNYEIILVDNNSSDDSMEFVKENYLNIQIIKLDSNFGFAYPNNIGAKKARGKFLLFLNNDTIVEPNFLTELLKPFALDPKIAICQSLLLKPNGDVDSSGDFIDSIGVTFSSHEKPAEIKEIFSAKAASMLMKKDIFEKLEGFDEKFFASFEDVDIGWRARILGYKIVVNPHSIVYHVGGETIKKIKDEIIFHGFKNQLVIKITNFETFNCIRSIILFIFLYGVKILKVALDYMIKCKTTTTTTKYEPTLFQKPKFSVLLQSISWLIKNYSYLKEKRKKVNSFRVISTQDMKTQKVII
jgi:GT2 family glycosyltransferase